MPLPHWLDSPRLTKMGGRGHWEVLEYQTYHDPESLRIGTQLQLLILGLLDIIHQGYSIELPQSHQFLMRITSGQPTSIQAG